MTEQFEGDQPKGCENCGAYNWVEKKCMYGTDAKCKAPDWHAWRAKNCRSCYFGGDDTDPNMKIAGFEPIGCPVKDCENYSKWRAVPRQPMPGDRPGDKPKTCGECASYGKCDGYVMFDNPAPFCFSPVPQPSAVPEQDGEFISALNALDKKYLSALHACRKVYSNELKFRVLSAHNRDVSVARKRIAELELDFNQAKENAETNAKLLDEALARIATFEAEKAQLPEQGEFERQVTGICTRWEYVPNFPVEVHNSTVEFLTAAHNRDMSGARARIAELEAQVPKTVIPVKVIHGGGYW